MNVAKFLGVIVFLVPTVVLSGGHFQSGLLKPVQSLRCEIKVVHQRSLGDKATSVFYPSAKSKAECEKERVRYERRQASALRKSRQVTHKWKIPDTF